MGIDELVKLLEELKTEDDLRAVLFEIISGRISMELFLEALKKAKLDSNIEKILNETDKEENDNLKGRKK